MLTDFFRINMPYGLQKNKDGEWMAFNREYMPLGFNTKDYWVPTSEGEDPRYGDLPIFTKFPKFTDEIMKGIIGDEDFIHRDEKGNIKTVFFYDDSTNPVNRKENLAEHYSKYWTKLQRLATIGFID